MAVASGSSRHPARARASGCAYPGSRPEPRVDWALERADWALETVEWALETVEWALETVDWALETVDCASDQPV
ncbi:hypothetical protein A5788_20620 [Gordonia sp. 852002-50816_SCH5313054-c]|nr:hypothetical protein A5785_02735 [Gordonia sp. 852002-50395_SCH5434458]OBC13328.1 hypothetical protein A5788_20620 [Gordonia sp. 852002-50816_SCH5313054-c]OBC16104.1 hypothetical protein A5786_20055 [Gordonia sp. 852002-50816_SCH5313054-a]